MEPTSGPSSSTSDPPEQGKIPASHGCEQCDKKFPTKSRLEIHRKSHSTKEDFRCSFCPFATNFKQVYIEHLRIHTGARPYRCPEPDCSSTFAHHSGLNHHLRIHRRNQGDETTLKYQCSLCTYKTIRKSDLQEHERNVHSETKDFGCELCPYRAKLQAAINKHHKFFHLTEKPYKCPHLGCNYACKKTANLNEHMKTHSEEKPFACSVAGCDYKSRRKGTVQRHEKTHAGDSGENSGDSPKKSPRVRVRDRRKKNGGALDLSQNSKESTGTEVQIEDEGTSGSPGKGTVDLDCTEGEDLGSRGGDHEFNVPGHGIKTESESL